MNIVNMMQNGMVVDEEFKASSRLISATLHFFLELDFMPYLTVEMRLIEKLFRFEDGCDLNNVIEAVKKFREIAKFMIKNAEAFTYDNIENAQQQLMFLGVLQASVASVGLVLGIDEF